MEHDAGSNPEKAAMGIYEAVKWVFTPNIRLASGAESDSDVFESGEMLLYVLNSIQDGVSILDSNLNIRFVNTSMQYWYSGLESLVGKKCYVAYHNRKEPCENCPTLKALASGTPEREVVKYRTAGDDRGWQELFSVPIFDREDKILGVFEYVRDITFQYRVEHELGALIERLESLENKNEAMAQLLRQRKEEQEQLEETILHNVEKFIRPSLQTIKCKAGCDDVELVESLIDEIVYPITRKRPSRLERLSSRELEIAVLIKEGKTSKEIAEILVVAPKTVEYHRANIRRKLGLNDDREQKANLRSYLVSHL